MDDPNFFKIFVAAIGFGIGSECLKMWRAYKQRRALLTAAERNSGFWTDGRLLAAEIAVWTALIFPPVYAILLIAVLPRFLTFDQYEAALPYLIPF